MAPARAFLSFALLCTILAQRPANAQTRAAPLPVYRHGYYLFLADAPTACEACYVPLLVTADPLEDIAKRPGGQSCLLITTYERDSIWQMDGMVQVMPTEIEVAPRIIQVRKRRYRYQEVTRAEILQLLERPLGTIPISRPMLHSDLPPGPTLDELKSALRGLP